ncbi:dihydroorotase [Myxosarcina sp. GI1]|uniref:dihydroorotase n=1 Tax=Myxosarcina sp. GI1 TaxID=1541065 RepID=UPI0005661665|nr:dihydroorotase [Myxosarcina sp. GI1]
MNEEAKLLRQVRIIDPVANSDRQQDVLLVNGRVATIETSLTNYPQHTAVVDARGMVLGTGLVDLYSHSAEPGNESRETLQELAETAAAGGFTQIAILPDTVPAINNPDILASLQQRSKNLCSRDVTLPQIHFWAAAFANTQTMNELAELKTASVGFTGKYNLGELYLLKQMLEYIKPWQKPVAIALTDKPLSGMGVAREGAASIRQGLLGNPAYSETATIAAALEIIAAINTPVHIMRVSTQRSVELIASAKQRGVPITASTTWMHLLHDTETLDSYDPNLRLEPPLGNKNDRLGLIDGVKQGIIDAIAIDHRAYTYEEKTVSFAQTPPGVVGLSIALPLLWQRFVSSGEWTALELWKALSSRPLSCLQRATLPISALDATELVLFAPTQTWLASSNNLKSPANNTLWRDRQITGKVIQTWRGKNS